jgi:hypothetical protein
LGEARGVLLAQLLYRLIALLACDLLQADAEVAFGFARVRRDVESWTFE